MTTDTQTPTLVKGPDPDTQAAGSTTGDYTVSDEFSVRFTWDMHDGTFASMTATHYVTAHVVSDGEVEDLSYDDWEHLFMTGDEEGSDPDPARRAGIRYTVKCTTEWIRHTDPEDPGSTEVATEYDIEDLSTHWIEVLDTATWIAKRLSSLEDPESYHPENAFKR